MIYNNSLDRLYRSRIDRLPSHGRLRDVLLPIVKQSEEGFIIPKCRRKSYLVVEGRLTIQNLKVFQK